MALAREPHEPVLLREAVESLVTDKDGRYLDGTLGMGGHSAAILRALSPRGRLLALDVDPAALSVAAHRLSAYSESLTAVRGNFKDAAEIAAEQGFVPLSGALLDLGFSSYQIDRGGKGLSFNEDSPLDMRLDPSATLTAADVVNTWSEEELADLFFECGERRSRPLARAIVRARLAKPILTTRELAELCLRHGSRGRLHPATLAFMALRIAVNQERENLEQALEGLKKVLAPGGRLAVISFHSLEDRAVKQAFRRWEQEGGWKALTKKPIVPTREEQARNARSRSAKLRVVERDSWTA